MRHVGTRLYVKRVVVRRGDSLTLLMRELNFNVFMWPSLLVNPRDKQTAWLTGTADAAWELVQPYPSAQMVAYQVSDAVNSAKNQGPDLLKPVAA